MDALDILSMCTGAANRCGPDLNSPDFDSSKIKAALNRNASICLMRLLLCPGHPVKSDEESKSTLPGNDRADEGQRRSG